MKDLNAAFIKVKDKKVYKDLVEFQNIVQKVQSIDENCLIKVIKKSTTK